MFTYNVAEGRGKGLANAEIVAIIAKFMFKIVLNADGWGRV